MKDPDNNRKKEAGSYEISGLRPRLFIRNDAAECGRGLRLGELRARMRSKAYKEWISYDGGVKSWNQLPSVAMRYLLYGKQEDAFAVGEFLATAPYPHSDVTAYGAAFGGIAFDWVREALPSELARRAADKLVEGVEPLLRDLEHPTVNHNYTYVSLYALAVAALAIHGENEDYTDKAEKYLKRVKQLIEGDGMILETFRNKEGVWAEGNQYSPYVVLTPFLLTLTAFTSSTGTDYFDIIRNSYDSFLNPMGRYIVANMRPDWTLERIGDMGSRWVNPNSTQMRPLIELIAREQGDPVLTGQLRSFCEELQRYHGETLVPDYYRWMMLVIYDESLPVEPSFKSLPLYMRLGRKGYEQIMFRNGWEEDSTLVTAICGEHYTDHQHFDKGSFLIYHKGGLAIDSGAYTSMYKDHWTNYAVRTLAHNCLLMVDPDDEPVCSVSGTTAYPDGGQRLIRGVQSNKNWQSYLEMRSLHRMDTAEVKSSEYDEQNRYYGYLKSDLTRAYGVKAELVERQLVYLPGVDYLVVKDRVVSSKPLEKSWLLHFSEKPWIGGQQPEDGINEYCNNRVIRAERTGELSHTGKSVKYDGALMVKTLLPEESTVTAVGGEGYRFYNRLAEIDFDEPKSPAFDPFSPIRESGSWRIEVTPDKAAENTVFLHALEISDAKKKEMVEARYIRSDEGQMEGVLFAGYGQHQLVMFREGPVKVGYACGNAPKLTAFDYRIKATAPVLNILTELQPHSTYYISVNGERIAECQASDAGIITFIDNGEGDRKISVDEV